MATLLGEGLSRIRLVDNKADPTHSSAVASPASAAAIASRGAAFREEQTISEAQGFGHTMPSPKTPSHKAPIIPAFAVAPRKDPLARQDARITALERQVQELIRENETLKNRLRVLEDVKETESKTMLASKQELETSFAAIVAAQKKEQETVQVKIDNKVQMAIRECRLQDSFALKARIGGLPPPSSWWTAADTIEETIKATIESINSSLNSSIQEATIDTTNSPIQPIIIEPDQIETIENIKGHCILTFKNKGERMKLLRQSYLLKGTKLWIAEELTSSQLKDKASELKKMREARQQGKWAVFRGGKALIQEFRTPKPAPPSPTPP